MQTQLNDGAFQGFVRMISRSFHQLLNMKDNLHIYDYNPSPNQHAKWYSSSSQVDECLQYQECLINQSLIKLDRKALIKHSSSQLDECLTSA